MDTPKVTRPVLLELLRRSVRLASAIADLLQQCESKFRDGMPSNVAPAKQLEGVARFPANSPFPYLDDPEFRERLLRVVANSWSEVVRPRSARRPDVLSLVAQLLANPAYPHTI